MITRSFLVLVGLSLLACTGLGESTDTGSGDEARACDGKVWYKDQDGDGFGDKGDTFKGCVPDGPYIADHTDCDDADPAIYPGAQEVCDDHHGDEDCDGVNNADDPDAVLIDFYLDADADGFGDDAQTLAACELPEGYVAAGGDCDDAHASAYPGGAEVCDLDGADEDCDGKVNDDDDSMDPGGVFDWYPDGDGDGYGDGTAVRTCDAGAGYATENGDCDDDEPAANPGETETCNDGIDNDCDGTPNDCGFSGALAATDADAVVNGLGGDNAGYWSRPAGDQNGDGVDDLLISAPFAADYGEAYIVYGPLSGTSNTGSADVTITNGGNSYSLGDGLAGGFDWNNDGAADVAVGDSQAGSDGDGAIYLYYGGVSADTDIYSADRTLTGSSGDRLGMFMDGCDVDGDSKDDLAYADYDGNLISIDRGPISTGSAAANSVDDQSYSITTALSAMAFGDADGDGADDLLIGSNEVSSAAGRVWFVEGAKSSGTSTVSVAATSTITGGASDDNAGLSVAFCDVTGDGHPDTVLGAPKAAGGGTHRGSVYVFDYGYSGTKTVSSATATLSGAASNDYFGNTVACVDIDMDGKEDLGITAPLSDINGTDSGAAYVYFGDLTGAISTTAADASIEGDAAGDTLADVASVGDVTGDGAPDFAFGAVLNDDGGKSGGGVWVFSGGGE